MTARRYGAYLLAAFLTPAVVIYGGLAIITSIKPLQDWFGDQLFRSLRTDVKP